MAIGDWASVATALGVFLAAGGLFAQSRLRKLAIAQAYVERFWRIDDEQTAEESKWGTDHSLTLAQKRYLRLCEDEYEIARLGWVEAGVWNEWHSAIEKILADHKFTSDEYDLLQECTGALNSAIRGHTPSTCPSQQDKKWRRKAVAAIERIVG